MRRPRMRERRAAIPDDTAALIREHRHVDPLKREAPNREGRFNRRHAEVRKVRCNGMKVDNSGAQIRASHTRHYHGGRGARMWLGYC